MLFLFFIISITVLSILLNYKTVNQPKFITFMVKFYRMLFCLLTVFLASVIFFSYQDEIIAFVERDRSNPTSPAPLYTDKPSTLFKDLYKHNPFSVQINAPLIAQYPELPRGCEVTALAMLLQFHDVSIDKMTLAEQVVKDDTPFQRIDGQIHFGNPYDGFVGDMYSLDQPGYGVYHGPIYDLATQYLGDRVVDLTGSNFEQVLYHLSLAQPVWVITNATYAELPAEAFENWETPSGSIDITMRQHAVLVTGYDQGYIYFNDPLTNQTKKSQADDFRAAWKQMGKQAITVITP
ncbi:C39 family peptidase [Amphibacillus sediminis]|uniref:C39 family peptidase n=1 Tax=Amphibacillus sediminis TaxID=360185 RepID=UPI0009FB7C19|nr:C39 family peptidase [Amphibacillus sediminis]